MNYRMVTLCVLIGFLVYFSTASAYLQTENQEEGKIKFENKCSKCHPLSVPLSKNKDLTQWKATALRMSQKQNSEIGPEEAGIIAEYLNLVSGQ
ncbi:MAG: hypothetical protein V1739_01115 [Candidatus Omnitrophota bacterium]